MGGEAAGFYENSAKDAPDIYLPDTSTLRRLGDHDQVKANKKIFDIDDVPGWWDRRVLPFIDLETVPIREERVRELSRLPGIHKDLFDRMLIAQARTEDMSLVPAMPTSDRTRPYVLYMAMRRRPSG
jgi:hypothetical protein